MRNNANPSNPLVVYAIPAPPAVQAIPTATETGLIAKLQNRLQVVVDEITYLKTENRRLRKNNTDTRMTIPQDSVPQQPQMFIPDIETFAISHSDDALKTLKLTVMFASPLCFMLLMSWIKALNITLPTAILSALQPWAIAPLIKTILPGLMAFGLMALTLLTLHKMAKIMLSLKQYLTPANHFSIDTHQNRQLSSADLMCHSPQIAVSARASTIEHADSERQFSFCSSSP